ncbi:MAG: site-2 protease family protein, partial [Verrucomicrobiaceae bacterium]
MKWSVRLGRFFGIDVFLHFTFLLFFAWLGYGAYVRSGHNMVETLHTIALLAGVFTCVILHEYGHALTARRFGVGTHDITLLPIGGVARLERMPANPRQELLVAIAGPAVNLAIILLILAWLIIRGEPFFQSHTAVVPGTFLRALLFFNGMMICFNLLPAFPMDGGRVLRALLAMRMPYAKATRAAATVGQGMAVLFALYGLMNPEHYMILFIALFVWIGASNEAEDAEE